MNTLLNSGKNIAEISEELMDSLVKDYGVNRSEIVKLRHEVQQQSSSMSKFYKTIYPKLLEMYNRVSTQSPEELKDFVSHSNQVDIKFADMFPPAKDKKITDEEIIAALKTLSEVIVNNYKLGSKKDYVRALAARFGVDPDLYLVSGLGSLPDNPTDEDYWKTMDISNKGKLPFYNHSWQILYIDALEKLQKLTRKRKRRIRREMDIAREKVTLESYKLKMDIVVLIEDVITIIKSGSRIKLFNEKKICETKESPDPADLTDLIVDGPKVLDFEKVISALRKSMIFVSTPQDNKTQYYRRATMTGFVDPEVYKQMTRDAGRHAMQVDTRDGKTYLTWFVGYTKPAKYPIYTWNRDLERRLVAYIRRDMQFGKPVG